MFQQPPISQQLTNIKLPDAVTNSLASVTNSLSSVKSNATSSFNEFSSKTISSSTDFLTSNSIIARIAFIFLVLIAFIIFFNLGMKFIVWAFGPTENPYLVKGLISGNTALTIPQDALVDKAIPLMRSNNKPTGMEFTWSVWLNISAPPAANGTYQHVFHKGDATIPTDPTTLYNTSPGLYIYRSEATSNVHLIVVMSSFASSTPIVVDIDNISLKKWVHVAIRLENTLFDVYINGIIAQRYIFQGTVPRQNYGSVYVCQSIGSASAGFSGSVSDLRYYSSALNVFSIQSIATWGPNMTPYDGSVKNGKFSAFLAQTWFSSRYK